MTLISDMQVLR